MSWTQALKIAKAMSFPDRISLLDLDYFEPKTGIRSVLDTTRLVEMVRDGRVGGTDALFHAYGRYVERLLVRVLGPDPEIEDLLHDVFAEALSSIHQLRDPEKLKPWLTRLTVNVARRALRMRTRRRALLFVSSEPMSEHASPTASPEVVDLIERVFDILGTLRPNHRLAFSLRYIEGMTLVEGAEAVGVSLATFKRWLKAANRGFISRAKKTDRTLYEQLLSTSRWGGVR